MAEKRTKESDVWKRVDALHVAEKLADDPGFTVYEYAERYGISVDGAHGRLNKLVRKGKLVAGKGNRSGRRVNVYRFPD